MKYLGCLTGLESNDVIRLDLMENCCIFANIVYNYKNKT